MHLRECSAPLSVQVIFGSNHMDDDSPFGPDAFLLASFKVVLYSHPEWSSEVLLF